MKGKDLIELIKEHNLEEYDFPICGEDGIFVGYISIEEAYRTYKVPISKIRTLIRDKHISSVNILNKELIRKEDAEEVLKDLNSEKRKERKHNGFSHKRAN